VHNHPSGDPNPSAEDVSLTRRLVAVGDLVGIPVIDHVVVAGATFVSLSEKGLL
jgi:DNA repair protein RadC